MADLRNRSNMFGKSVGQDLETLSASVIRKGRILLIESLLLESVMLAESDMATAKSDLNDHIRTFGPGKIKVVDIFAPLWKLVQMVTRGSSPNAS